MDVKVTCNSCGQFYDQTLILSAGDRFHLLRIYNLFNYVPICRSCRSDDIVVAIHNPYRKLREQHIRDVAAAELRRETGAPMK